jgi:hypothetical protein
MPFSIFFFFIYRCFTLDATSLEYRARPLLETDMMRARFHATLLAACFVFAFMLYEILMKHTEEIESKAVALIRGRAPDAGDGALPIRVCLLTAGVRPHSFFPLGRFPSPSFQGAFSPSISPPSL